MKISPLESELRPLTETQSSLTIDVTQVGNHQVGCNSVATVSHRDLQQYVLMRGHVNGPHKINCVNFGQLESELRHLTFFSVP